MLGKPADKIGETLLFSVDGKDQIPLQKKPGYEATYSVDIGGGAVRVVQLLQSRWIGAGGYTAFSPARFTKRFTLEIVNNLEEAVLIKFEQPKMTIFSLSGRNRRDELLTLSDLEPANRAYAFYLFRSRNEFADWKAERVRSD